MNEIFPHLWMSLDKEVRLHLIKVFGLVRTGVTEIIDQTIVTDGFTLDDLKGISLEKMNEYIGSTEVFARAWELTLAKSHSELHPPLGEIKTAENGGMYVAPMPEPEAPAFGEKTCEVCGCKMSGPGVDENTECAEKDRHPVETSAKTTKNAKA